MCLWSSLKIQQSKGGIQPSRSQCNELQGAPGKTKSEKNIILMKNIDPEEKANFYESLLILHVVPISCPSGY